MNMLKLIAASAFAIIGSAAVAADGNDADVTSMLTRAQVESDVARAVADGTLLRAGESDRYADRFVHGPSMLTRAEVKQQVLRARIDGTLLAAGEGSGFVDRAVQNTAYALTREQVKADVARARVEGTLLPAGEAYVAIGRQGARSFTQASFAR